MSLGNSDACVELQIGLEIAPVYIKLSGYIRELCLPLDTCEELDYIRWISISLRVRGTSTHRQYDASGSYRRVLHIV